MMTDRSIVSRYDWLHGLDPCPTCGLPLDATRDCDDYLWWTDDTRAYGVVGKHGRCGSAFDLYFDDVPPELRPLPRRGRYHPPCLFRRRPLRGQAHMTKSSCQDQPRRQPSFVAWVGVSGRPGRRRMDRRLDMTARAMCLSRLEAQRRSYRSWPKVGGSLGVMRPAGFRGTSNPGLHARSACGVGLTRSEPRDGFQEHVDVKRLVQHRRRTEAIGLGDRLVVTATDHDRNPRVAFLDATDDRPRAAAVVPTKTDEIGDHKVRSGVQLRVIHGIDEQKLVARVPEHLVEELSDRAIVVDHQDSSHRCNAGGSRRAAPL